MQGVLGIKVKIMLGWDPKGKVGPVTPLPDLVTIHTPKEDEEIRPVTTTTNVGPVADIIDIGHSPIPGQIPVV